MIIETKCNVGDYIHVQGDHHTKEIKQIVIDIEPDKPVSIRYRVINLPIYSDNPHPQLIWVHEDQIIHLVRPAA